MKHSTAVDVYNMAASTISLPVVEGSPTFVPTGFGGAAMYAGVPFHIHEQTDLRPHDGHRRAADFLRMIADGLEAED